MDLSEQDLKKIKSLHVMLKMPIWILERETNRVLKSYKSIYKYPISYEFKEKNTLGSQMFNFFKRFLRDVLMVSGCQNCNWSVSNK